MQLKVVLAFLAAVLAVGFGSMVGGYRDVDIENNEGAQNALHFAMAKHNEESNDMYQRQMLEVVKVQAQIVSGIQYRITAKMFRTNCRKNQECATNTAPDQSQVYQCTFTVWSRPWISDIQLKKQEC